MEGGPCGIRIPYAVKDADCGGKGLFTVSKVSTGDLIWKFTEGQNVIMYDGDAASAHLSDLSPLEAKSFLDATYGLKGEITEKTTCLILNFEVVLPTFYYHIITDKLCSITDDGKFMNHSSNPNCFTDMETGYTYALRDIDPGEQLFEDYATFEHPVFLLPLLKKYDCAPDYYDIPDMN
jgi:SET domain